MITAKTQLCMVIGDPISHSLSPEMHNAGFKALGIDDRFVFVAANVVLSDIETTVKAIKVLGIRGVSCTMPHKLEVREYLDELDETAQKIGAVNTIVNENGKLKGYNTDWLGVVTPLKQHISLNGKKAVVIGAGGAARAMIYGLLKEGCQVIIYNRTLEKAEELARDFGCMAKGMEEIGEIKNADIILNATSLGMAPHAALSPVQKELFQKHHLVFDAIYHPHQTILLKDAKEAGATIVTGLEMLLYQGTAQFELYTGEKAPVKEMEQVLRKHI